MGKVFNWVLHARGKRVRSKEVLPETFVEKLLWLSAAVSVVGIVLIIGFVCIKGVPLMAKVGLADFLFSTKWDPTNGHFGIGAMIVGSFVVTTGALLWGVPLGLALSIFIAEIAPGKVARIMSEVVNLLAGIPSVVYGFVGLVVLVPFIREHFGGWGFSVLTGALVLGIMILPTIVGIARDAILAVPREYKESSLALGATQWQTITRIILPAARSGIVAAVVLGMGRAVGETMAVVMVTGNVARVPGSILDPVRTMTSNVVLEMGYAHGDHQLALFATATVLFVFILGLNLIMTLNMKAGK